MLGDMETFYPERCKCDFQYHPPNHLPMGYQITWIQLSVARSTYIFNIQHVINWPADIARSFTLFFYNLDNLPLKTETLGIETIIHYQAAARREWFDMYKRSDEGNTFDISEINQTKLMAINTKLIRDAAHKDRFVVSFFPLPVPPIAR